MSLERIHEIALALNTEFDEARWMFDILIRRSLSDLETMYEGMQ